MKKPVSGLQHLINATLYSMKGLKSAFRYETAFRQEVLVFIILFPASFFIAENFVVWSILILPLFTAIIIELLNSGLEAIVDRVGRDFHELSGRAKDLGSAAVFVNMILIVLIWSVFIVDKYIYSIF